MELITDSRFKEDNFDTYSESRRTAAKQKTSLMAKEFSSVLKGRKLLRSI